MAKVKSTTVQISIDGSTPVPAEFVFGAPQRTEQSQKERKHVVEQFTLKLWKLSGNKRMADMVKRDLENKLRPFVGTVAGAGRAMEAMAKAARAAGVQAAEMHRQIEGLKLNTATGEELEKLMKARGK